MGHVINAKAMRIGWSTLWSDQWYSEIQYYSEYLHAIFRIRYYLIYIFSRKHFDKKAIFYSHFEIIKHYKNLYVEIYLYSGKLESDYENYKFNFFYKLYNMEKNKDPETREPFFLYTALKLVLIFDWLHFFYCRFLSTKDLLSFIIFLRQYKIKNIKQALNKLSFKKYIVKEKYKYKIKNKMKKLKILKALFNYDFINTKINYNVLKKILKKNFKKKFKNIEKNINLSKKYKLNIKDNIIKYKKKKYIKKNIFIFSKSDIYFFILLFTTFISAKISIGKISIWKQPNRNITLRRFYMAGAIFQEMSKHLNSFVLVLSFVFQNLTKFLKVFVNFFLINNNCVNAKFLSRFIARKLKQNYPVKELLNPIKKELLLIIAISRRGSKSYNLSLKKNYLTNITNLTYRRSIFKALLSSIFVLYKKHSFYYFVKNKIWYNLELLILFIWFKFNLKTKKDLILVSSKYFLNRCGYLCFFDYKFSIKTFKRLFLPKIKQLYILSYKEKFFGLFNIIYNSIYTSKLSFFDLIYFDLSYKISSIYLRSLYINYNRYLKFNYWYYHYNWLINDFKMNYLKLRMKSHTKTNNLKGYKMHLTGRFTRKQRAASYWFSKGKVPLNSINEFIDYAFFTIPLSNSAITVKVWLYKSDDISNNYFLKIF